MKAKQILSVLSYITGTFFVLLSAIAFFSLEQAELGAVAILPLVGIFVLFSLIILFRRSWKNGIIYMIVLFLSPFVYFNCKWEGWLGTKVFFSAFLLLLYSFFFLHRKNSFKISCIGLVLPMSLLALYIYNQEQYHKLIDNIPFQIVHQVHQCLEQNAKKQLPVREAQKFCQFDYSISLPKGACLEMFKDPVAQKSGITKYPIHGGARDGWGNKLPQYGATRVSSVRLNGKATRLENCQSDNILTYNIIPDQGDMEYYKRRKQFELEESMRRILNGI